MFHVFLVFSVIVKNVNDIVNKLRWETSFGFNNSVLIIIFTLEIQYILYCCFRKLLTCICQLSTVQYINKSKVKISTTVHGFFRGVYCTSKRGFPMWSFMTSYNIGGLTLVYPLCTNGSRALGRRIRCQGQRSAALQWWTSSCPRHLTTKYLPFPSHPTQRHATPRADANDPYFYSPFHLVLRAALFVPRLLADPRAPVIFIINDCRPFV